MQIAPLLFPSVYSEVSAPKNNGNFSRDEGCYPYPRGSITLAVGRDYNPLI